MNNFLPDSGIQNNAIYNLKHNGSVYIVQLLSNPSEEIDMYFNPERIYKQVTNADNIINIVRADDVTDDLLMELENEVSKLNQKLIAMARMVKLIPLVSETSVFEKYGLYCNDSYICDVQTTYYEETGQYILKYQDFNDLIVSKLHHIFGYDYVTNSHIVDLAYLNIKGSVVL